MKNMKPMCSNSNYGKESACSAGDPGSIPGLGRFPGEGNGYPLQYSGLEDSMDYSCKESDTTQGLSLSLFPTQRYVAHMALTSWIMWIHGSLLWITETHIPCPVEVQYIYAESQAFMLT